MKLTKEIIEKIRGCKALQGKAVADICQTDDFLRNLQKYIQAQKDEREAAKNAIPKGCRLPAHVIDRIQAAGLLDSPTLFAKEYCKILNRESELKSAEREYVWQVGQQAYNLTIVNAVIKEYPELKDVLLNTKKQS